MQSHICFIEYVLNTLNKVKRKHKFLDDKPAGKMQHRLIAFGLLFPLGQDPAKAIHPAMSPPDDPATGFEVRVFTGVRLLFTGLDMRLVAAAL
ncbi:Uncharacterised protein [Salmonella enterica subsp. enterica serovar Sanjuan]|uniref:Uncharacterized protein n=2 Tax=Salmonella enterica subsp. enterica serovar Sanjuan TaxID=1160765 RepID=A0A3S4FI38_SALET|nr:Uncharacterised protein [Salmonella enterica subsp. enterica serovar Sanjuan]